MPVPEQQPFDRVAFLTEAGWVLATDGWWIPPPHVRDAGRSFDRAYTFRDALYTESAYRSDGELIEF